MSGVELFKRRLLALSSAREPERMLFATPLPASPADGPSSFAQVSDCHEFGLVATGQVLIRTQGATYRVTPGDLLVLAPHVAHLEEPADRRRGYTMFWCSAEENRARLGETVYAPKSGWRSGPSIEVFGRTDIGNIAIAIAVELHHRDEGWHECVQSLLRYLSYLLIRRLSHGKLKDAAPPESPTINGDPRACRVVQTALQFCEDNHWQRIGLKDVAGAVGYSPSYVSRLFASHLGCSVSEHLRELRMEAAKSMLERSEASISEIGRWLGYRDPANFTHAFTRAVGMPPKAFREQLRGL
jgi:AraC-like DNA-binding protein